MAWPAWVCAVPDVAPQVRPVCRSIPTEKVQVLPLCEVRQFVEGDVSEAPALILVPIIVTPHVAKVYQRASGERPAVSLFAVPPATT